MILKSDLITPVIGNFFSFIIFFLLPPTPYTEKIINDKKIISESQ